MNLDLNLIFKVCIIIVLVGIAFRLLKFVTSIVFKLALFALVILALLKFFKVI